jgi:hypothetical protein
MKNGDTAGPLVAQLHRGVGDGVQAADAGSQNDAGAAALGLVLGHPVRIAHRLIGGGHRIEDEVVDPPLLAGAHGLVRVEGAVDVRPAAAAAVDPRHLASDLAGVVRRIKGADSPGAGLAGQKRGPGLFRAPGEGRDHTYAGDHDAPHPRGQLLPDLKSDAGHCRLSGAERRGTSVHP